MRAKRWGRAGHGREQPRRRVFFLAVLAGLLVCVVLPVRAQKKTGKLCFPLDTTQYRVSDGYGWRQDPFTGERTFHKGIDLACAEGTEVLAAEGGAVVQAYRSTSYGTVCVFSIQMAASHFTPICSTPMSARARWWKQGSCWAQQGAAGALREHTCILNCTGREQPVTRRMGWAFPHEAA